MQLFIANVYQSSDATLDRVREGDLKMISGKNPEALPDSSIRKHC
jgi:hypothetical protein